MGNLDTISAQFPLRFTYTVSLYNTASCKQSWHDCLNASTDEEQLILFLLNEVHLSMTTYGCCNPWNAAFIFRITYKGVTFECLIMSITDFRHEITMNLLPIGIN